MAYDEGLAQLMRDDLADLDGVGEMLFTGRPMGGMVDAAPEAMADDATRAQLTALSVAYAKSLPPK